MNPYKPVFCLLAATILLPSLGNAQETFRYMESGDWTEVATPETEQGWALNDGTFVEEIPGAGDQARINWEGNTVTITSEVPTIQHVRIGIDEDGTLIVADGGSIHSTDRPAAGWTGGEDVTGTLIVESGGTFSTDAILWIAHNGTNGVMIVEEGGVVTVGNHLWWAPAEGSVATVEIAGTVTQTSGILGLGTINAVDPSGGTATVYISGDGHFHLNNIHGGGTSIQPGSVIDITDNGRLTVSGNHVDSLTGYVENEFITGNGRTGLANVIIDFDSDENITTVTSAPQTFVDLTQNSGDNARMRPAHEFRLDFLIDPSGGVTSSAFTDDGRTESGNTYTNKQIVENFGFGATSGFVSQGFFNAEFSVNFGARGGTNNIDVTDETEVRRGMGIQGLNRSRIDWDGSADPKETLEVTFDLTDPAFEGFKLVLTSVAIGYTESPDVQITGFDSAINTFGEGVDGVITVPSDPSYELIGGNSGVLEFSQGSHTGGSAPEGYALQGFSFDVVPLDDEPGTTLTDVYDPEIVADFVMDFGTGTGKDDETSLLRTRPDDFTLQDNALRLTTTSDSFSSFRANSAVASVVNRQASQGFVVESEMAFNQFADVRASRAGLILLGGPHDPPENRFNPQVEGFTNAPAEADFYSLSFYPALEDSQVDSLFPDIEPAADGYTAIISISRGFDGPVLGAARWDGRKPFSESILLADDFEDSSTDDDWVTGGDQDSWEIGTPGVGPDPVEGSSRVAATNLDGPASEFSEDYLRSPPIELTDASAVISFREALNIDDDPSFHVAIVSIVDVDGEFIHELARYSGNSGGWREQSFTIPSEILGQTIRVEFHLSTDDLVLSDQFGWMIDDFSVGGFVQDDGAYALKGEGNYDNGELQLEFTLTDLEDQDSWLSVTASGIADPLNGNLFGIGGRLQASPLGNPEIDFNSLSMSLGEAPEVPGFDAWAEENIPDENQRGFASSPAGDGIANGIKFAFGLDPMQSFGAGELVVPGRDENGRLTITYQVDTEAEGVSVTPEVALDLDQGEWFRDSTGGDAPYVVVDDGTQIEGSIYEFTATAMNIEEETAAFMRVSVELN